MPAPDLVTCIIGGNDVAWTGMFHTDNFARDIEAIAAQLPDGTVMGSVPNFMHWPYENRARKANRMILQAADRYGHAVADIHSPTMRLSLRGYMGTFGSDWFHPNEKGHALWADAIWDQLSYQQGSPAI